MSKRNPTFVERQRELVTRANVWSRMTVTQVQQQDLVVLATRAKDATTLEQLEGISVRIEAITTAIALAS